MEGKEKLEFMNRLSFLSNKISNDYELEKEWRSLIQSRKDYFISSFFPFNPKITSRILRYGLDKFFVPRKHFLKILNLVRCESHRDILINSFKEKFFN